MSDELSKAADQLQYVQTLEISENAEFNKAVSDFFFKILFIIDDAILFDFINLFTS